MRTWFYGPGSRITLWGVALLGGMTVEGSEHVPRSGPFILVTNHASLIDPPIVGATVGFRNRRIIHFMAKQEIRRWPLIGYLADAAGVFFVRRGEGDRAAQRLALRLLAEGHAIAMFPEGTRSRDGRLRDGRSGAALLAMRSGAPVLPAGIAGTQRVFPGRSRWPHRSRLTLRIGRPFALDHMPAGRLDRHALSAGTERIMREIAALLPPDQQPAPVP